MDRLVSGFVVMAIVLAMGLAARAETVARGRVTYVSTDVVEFGGHRALVTRESHIMSGGREISVTSLRRGMLVEGEIDDAGHLMVLEANGVVE